MGLFCLTMGVVLAIVDDPVLLLITFVLAAFWALLTSFFMDLLAIGFVSALVFSPLFVFEIVTHQTRID